MSYYVSLGNIELEQVASVTQSRSRDITVYDGVGSGKFSVPQSKGLRSWSIKCDISDYDSIKALEKMQKRNTPVRLVINAPDYKVSERVLLKEHSAQQDYADVFSVSISLMEYAKASVLTTDVPFVARPGKAPALPKTVTIDYAKNVTPYAVSAKAQDPENPEPKRSLTDIMNGNSAVLFGQQSVTFYQLDSVRPLNPAGIRDGERVGVVGGGEGSSGGSFDSSGRSGGSFGSSAAKGTSKKAAFVKRTIITQLFISSFVGVYGI